MPPHHALFLSALLTLSLAAQPQGSVFENTAEVSGRSLLKNGQALCEWGFLEIDLWRAALYLPERTGEAAKALDPTAPKRLDMRYARKLSAKQLGEAWTASLRANASATEVRYRRRLAALNALMVDVKADDRMIFDHLPGQGLSVRVLDRPPVVIEGDDFATMFFTMFLGPKPPTEQVRRGLLGGVGE